jgi:hypothetical protein
MRVSSSYSAMSASIKFAVMIITLAVWSIVGMAFWIPLLARTVAIYTAKVAAATFTNTDISGADKALDAASLFYLRGFINICSSIWGVPLERESKNVDMDYMRLIIETVYTGFFWFISYALFVHGALKVISSVFGA